MIYVIHDKYDAIIGAVDTKCVVGFEYDGTSPNCDHRYILKLDWGHTLMVNAIDMQHILSAIEREAGDKE